MFTLPILLTLMSEKQWSNKSTNAKMVISTSYTGTIITTLNPTKLDRSQSDEKRGGPTPT